MFKIFFFYLKKIKLIYSFIFILFLILFNNLKFVKNKTELLF